MKKLETFLKKKVNAVIDKDEDSWPPVCLGIFHQPERPISSKRTHIEGSKEVDSMTKS